MLRLSRRLSKIFRRLVRTSTKVEHHLVLRSLRRPSNFAPGQRRSELEYFGLEDVSVLLYNGQIKANEAFFNGHLAQW